MPEDWGHTQTHTTYSKAQLEAENICYTFLFGLCPLIKTVAPPSFGNFHCQITSTACLSCAAVREFLGKEYSMENLFNGGPFAFDHLLSVTRVAQSYIKKVEMTLFFCQRPNGVRHISHFYCLFTRLMQSDLSCPILLEIVQ